MDRSSTHATGTVLRHALNAGWLDLKIHEGADSGLFEIAERINPKRAFLFVSTVLGRHIPVAPSDHRAALRAIAARIDPLLLPGPVFVMGFAETAVGIGAGVYDCLCDNHPDKGMGYLTTTRFAVPGIAPWFTVEEAHSHAVDHIIMTPEPGIAPSGTDATLILVDDETTTGKTFHELAQGIAAQGLAFGRVILATLTDWSSGQAAARLEGCFAGADVHAVSLLRGEWAWTPNDDAPLQTLPPARPAQCPPWHPTKAQPLAAPRLGLSSEKARESGADILARLRAAGLPPVTPSDRVLVMGAGEHVWQPFLVAEALAGKCPKTRFITTTRSPIMQGRTIAHKLSFSDHYGLGIEMYLHNVVPADWDRILLFTETGQDGIAPALRRALPHAHAIDGDGTVVSLADPKEDA